MRRGRVASEIGEDLGALEENARGGGDKGMKWTFSGGEIRAVFGGRERGGFFLRDQVERERLSSL